MSTTNVAGSVVPVYTPTLLVTNDASILTQADLTALTLSLANRIEFLRDLTDDAADTPETSCVIREEFWSAFYTSALGRLDADNIWQASNVGSPSVLQGSATATAPGELNIFLHPSESFHFQVGTSTSKPFSFTTFQHATMRVRVLDDAAATSGLHIIGFAQDNSLDQGGTDSMQIVWDKLLAPTQWRLRVRKAGVSVFTNLAPFVDNTYITFRFVKVLTGVEIRDSANAVLTTVLNAALPAVECTFGGLFISSADTVSLKHSVDFLFVRGRPGR